MSPESERLAFPLGEIAEHVGGTLEGAPDVSIRGLAGLAEAGEGDLSFLSNPKYHSELAGTGASAVILTPDTEAPSGIAVVRAADPYEAIMRVAGLFDPGLPSVGPGIHPSAVVSPSAELGEGVSLGPHVVIEDRVRIGARTALAANCYLAPGAELGEDCYFFPGVYVGRDCRLGDRVSAHPGVVIGADGFGFAPVQGRLEKIPQLGIVEIGNDVEIGANTCIDRAAFGKTSIGDGTKIDNLVQIAHNVAVSEHCAIAAQCGIAGSTRVGRGVRFGGQAGAVGHVTIGDGVTVAGKCAATRDVPPGITISGFPSRPHREALKERAATRRIPELVRRVRALESKTSSGPGSDTSGPSEEG